MQRKFGTMTGDMHVGRREVAVRRVRREAPHFAIANHALPVQPVIVIGIQNRGAVLRQAGKDFTLRLSHTRQRAEALEVRGGEVVDQRRFRTRQADGPGDFALMVGAEFNHRILVIFIQTQQRHRNPDIVVQITGGIQRVAALAEDRRGHLFNRGFTGRAGQGDDASRHLLTHPGG
ncbi:Uncharacterised protein [Klebsiella pneumoniae]|nr:Uncharacterised protein [Klebsiella pneumoniae]